MIRPIMRDVLFLNQKSKPANEKDKQVAQDLIDTLLAHKNECVGMAANMIGVQKNIIVVDTGFMPLIMYNPVIVEKKGEYHTKEGCLSLIGQRDTIRYNKITVEYDDVNFRRQTNEFTGTIAEIIQHECDHLNGIII